MEWTNFDESIKLLSGLFQRLDYFILIISKNKKKMCSASDWKINYSIFQKKSHEWLFFKWVARLALQKQTHELATLLDFFRYIRQFVRFFFLQLLIHLLRVMTDSTIFSLDGRWSYRRHFIQNTPTGAYNL